MSELSQSSPTKRVGFVPTFALSMVVVGVILTGAMGPLGGRIVQGALTATPHAPDWALLGALSPVIKIHLYAALAAVALGAALMVVRKGRAFHRAAGWTWVALVAAVAGSSIFITELNHGGWSLLHLFTGWTFLILPLAVIAARRRSVARHRRMMMGLFYGGFAINLLIAFIPGRTLWQAVFG
ncbi:DUF2306 domain-containing protein [Phenylobacterium immobile]|uniref:DUF2306 domain-containing protein n=1 Tax=Phenylobacterium immobile TaxID=21 RepID=UPI000AFD69A9|nr:DUF2306 domain-containing protein [Phenylobacterium immobile]